MSETPPERIPRRLTLASPFQVAWQSMRDLFEEMFKLVAINVLWFLISAPLVIVAIGLIIAGDTLYGPLLLVLGALAFGPANVGLYTVAQRVADGRAIRIGLFFEGLRGRWKLAWKVYAPWAFGLALTLVNQQFYATQVGGTIGAAVAILFLYMIGIWFAVLIYLGPLIMLQEDTRVRTIYRNALLMALGRPLFSLLTLVLMTVIFVLSLAFPLLIATLTGALLAQWGFRATSRLIEDAAARQRELNPPDPTQPQTSNEKGRGGQIRPRG